MREEQGHLLIVDDDETIRTTLARYFTKQELAVAEAADGDQALAAVGARPFDLVILDMVMPGRGGLEVLETLRRTYSPTDLPVIMATARGESSDVVEALRLGANDYLVKPFDLGVAVARARTQLLLKRSVDRIACLERDLVRRNAELEAANHRLKSDLEAAAKVQKALLPRGLLEIPGVRLAWHFQPCHELAGDLLNVVRLDDRHVALYVLDVVGHGVKAALMAVMVSRAITQLLSPSQPREAGRLCEPRLMSPDRVVATLNRTFPWDDQTGQFCTLLYGILDLKTGKFDFVSAGHPGPLSIPLTGKTLSLTAPGPPLGLGAGKYRASSTTLRAGDRLYLYSEGVSEARGPSGQCFGQARLVQTLEQTRTLPLPDALVAVVHRIEKWYGPAAPHDDVTMLTIEYTGAFIDLPRTARAAGRGARAGAKRT